MREHRHWALLVMWGWGAVVMVLLAIAFNVSLDFVLGVYYQGVGAAQGTPDPRSWPNLALIRLAVTLLLIAIGGFWLTSVWYRWSNLILTITDYRIIRDIGTWPHTSGVIGLDRILDISTTQTAMGGLLNYGTIRINGQDQQLDFIPDPSRVAADIFVHVTNFKRAGAAAAKPGVQELQEEAAEAEAGAEAAAEAAEQSKSTHTH